MRWECALELCWDDLCERLSAFEMCFGILFECLVESFLEGLEFVLGALDRLMHGSSGGTAADAHDRTSSRSGGI